MQSGTRDDGSSINSNTEGKARTVPPTTPVSANLPDDRQHQSPYNLACGANPRGMFDSQSRGQMTSAQIQAQAYLHERKIFELFNFLIGHLLVDEPADPINYLVDLLNNCMLFRSGIGEPPLLFTSRHIESMFQSMDPGGLGNVSLDQYKAGMTTLGIDCYNANPKECVPGRVDKQTFEEEAKRCLEKMLRDMVGQKS